jgi:hypothetical protein
LRAELLKSIAAFEEFTNSTLPDPLPDAVKHGLLRLSAFRLKEPFVTPVAVAALWRPWRMMDRAAIGGE